MAEHPRSSGGRRNEQNQMIAWRFVSNSIRRLFRFRLAIRFAFNLIFISVSVCTFGYVIFFLVASRWVEAQFAIVPRSGRMASWLNARSPMCQAGRTAIQLVGHSPARPLGGSIVRLFADCCVRWQAPATTMPKACHQGGRRQRRRRHRRLPPGSGRCRLTCHQTGACQLTQQSE